MTFASGVATLGGSGVRFSVGATSTAASTPTTAPVGMFNLSGKVCTLVVNNAVAQTAGLFQVYINNNTTGAANSPLGSASRVVNAGPANSNALVAGDSTFTFTAPTTAGTDFLQIRADGTAGGSGNIQINYIKLDCI